MLPALLAQRASPPVLMPVTRPEEKTGPTLASSLLLLPDHPSVEQSSGDVQLGAVKERYFFGAFHTQLTPHHKEPANWKNTLTHLLAQKPKHQDSVQW